MNQVTDRETRAISSAAPGDTGAPQHASGWKVLLVVILLAAMMAGLWFAGYLPRREREQAAAGAAHAEQTDVPLVTAARVRRSTPLPSRMGCPPPPAQPHPAIEDS